MAEQFQIHLTQVIERKRQLQEKEAKVFGGEAASAKARNELDLKCYARKSNSGRIKFLTLPDPVSRVHSNPRSILCNSQQVSHPKRQCVGQQAESLDVSLSWRGDTLSGKLFKLAAHAGILR